MRLAKHLISLTTCGLKLLAWLDTLPDGQRFCHGDYHPGNVILTKAGPIVIDWMTAPAAALGWMSRAPV